jgi:hypothetical protein
MNLPIHALGVPWYRDAAVYGAPRRMCYDSYKFQGTYEQWRSEAEAMCEHLKAAGHRVIRVDMDPHDFAEWCAAEGLRLDADARTRYCSWVAGEVVAGRRLG